MLTVHRCLVAVTLQSSASACHDSHMDEASSKPQDFAKEPQRTDDDAASHKEDDNKLISENTAQPSEPKAWHEQVEEHTAQEQRLGDELDRHSAKGKSHTVKPQCQPFIFDG